MLKTLLTLFEDQPSSIVNKIENEIVGKTDNNSGGGLIKNFQSLKPIKNMKKHSFQNFDDQLISDFDFKFKTL